MVELLASEPRRIEYEQRVSFLGNPYYAETKVMTRIDDVILGCAIYLYPSKQKAVVGEQVGGTGFVVGVRSEVCPQGAYLYAVTNYHVVNKYLGNSPVVRLNTKQGDFDAIEFNTSDWTGHPNGDDIAICPLGLHPDHEVNYISTDRFISQEIINLYNIGIGDDAFMVGRFINHEGKQRNTPSIRFGNISMMPLEPIKSPLGILQESFLIEARSMAGYSGSPVFVYIPPLSKRPRSRDLKTRGFGPWLLGVDWGHIPIVEVVKEKGGRQEVPEGWWVEYNAGMMGVVPVWKLRELLDEPKFKTSRNDKEAELRE